MARLRSFSFRQKYSIWSAYVLGVDISTVEGRLMMTGFSAVAPRVSSTASQISTA